MFTTVVNRNLTLAYPFSIFSLAVNRPVLKEIVS